MNELYYTELINICDRFPKNEKMLIIKIRCLKKLKKRYKYLESIEEYKKIKSSKKS